MNIIENIITVWNLIGRNKIRSFLTMLGIIIGVMSVIVIMSVGAGAQSLILNQVTGMGSNLVGVFPGKSEEKGPPTSIMGAVITTLKYEDIKKMKSGAFPYIVDTAVYVKGVETISWEDRKTDTTFVGTSFGYLNVEDTEVLSGRFFTEEEEKSISRVVILGSQVSSDLFNDENPIGRKIKIKKTNFQIIGVMPERGVVGFQNQDNQVFIPITSAQKLLLGINYINMARVKIDSVDNIDISISYIKDVLRDSHNIKNPEEEDFSVRSMAQGIETITNITNALKIFLAFIAAIALLVGGIGIMNVMLAAVEERTKEIGLRKAVGARNHQITSQFLIETVMITFIGGIIGIILGVFISYSASKIAQEMGYDWEFIVPISSILLACVVSITVGLIFGIIPARRASRLNPIEALRYE